MICNTVQLKARVTDPFRKQFGDPNVEALPAFTGRPSGLAERIIPDVVQGAIGKLTCGRTSGYDDKPAEVFKCTADLLAHTIAIICNGALEVHEQLGNLF